MDPHYVTGLADGLGTFTYSRSGHQLALYFGLKQDRLLLEELQIFFRGVGRIYDQVGRSYYRVTHRDDLAVIVDHFDRYPLRTKKQTTFEIWREMVMLKRAFRAPDRQRLDELATALSSR